MITIHDVHKRFGEKRVLEGVSLTIPEGKTAVIVGCSGCGKTVLLRSIIGLVSPDSGSIRVGEDEVVGAERRDLFRIRRRFGMLFQGAALFDSLTVAENIGLALREHTRLSRQEIRNRVREKLEVVGLSGIEDRKPAELSGGMRKRVGLARALIMDPRYVLFDEPTTGLDPVMSDAINRLIIGTQRRLGITAIVVTHDMTSAFGIGDKIAMISDGRIVFEGTPEAFRTSALPAVKQFVRGGLDG
ncbi:MAG TPA: ABC transporter ATP-binding protein [bacterium]|nr:ABC transporter ATP-binding protein [bacterium]